MQTCAGFQAHILNILSAVKLDLTRPKTCLAQVFTEGTPFDYGVTVSDAVDMPINMGMQFVQRGRFPHAISFLEDVVSIYPFNETFTAGQVREICCAHSMQAHILLASLTAIRMVPFLQ